MTFEKKKNSTEYSLKVSLKDKLNIKNNDIYDKLNKSNEWDHN